MEIKNLKFKYVSRSSDKIRTTKQSQALTLLLVLNLFVSVSIAADDFEPLDILEPPIAVIHDFNDIPDVNDINDTNAVPLDSVKTAQVNLLAKMENSIPLQAELQKLINQINSVQFKAKEDSQPILLENIDSNQSGETSESNESNQPKPLTEEKPAVPAIIPNAPFSQQPTLSDSNITNQTLSALDQIMQNPKEIQNPLELANILYKCGKLKEAAVCYQNALDVNDNNNVSYKDKAWILFQTGNCLQKSDPQTAAKMYKKLISEYPQSFWADAAVAKDHLVEWYIQQNPDSLLKKSK
ncbi:MAG: hypothetical protein ABFD79_11890 [Phycisphaerales bacterium]